MGDKTPMQEGTVNGRLITGEGVQNRLVGKIVSDSNLTGAIQGNENIIGVVKILDNYDDYRGPYKVTPKVRSQTIPTSDKHMTEDVTIEAIPYFEVSNVQNGFTVIIGGD